MQLLFIFFEHDFRFEDPIAEFKAFSTTVAQDLENQSFPPPILTIPPRWNSSSVTPDTCRASIYQRARALFKGATESGGHELC